MAGKTNRRWMIGKTWLSRVTLLPKRGRNEGMERRREFAELQMRNAPQNSRRKKLLFQLLSRILQGILRNVLL